MEREHPIFQKKKASLKELHQMMEEVEAQSLAANLNSMDEELPFIIESVKPSVVYIVGNVSAGSGIILTEDGDILTNAHVVSSNSRNQVELWDGTVYTAHLKCLDTFSDLALLKIEANGLTACRFAEKESIVKGKVVLAIGSPELFRESVTLGIISGLDRGLDGLYPYHLIQTDAVINHGNSGGPLVNLKGEVVGLNTFGLGATKGVEVLNFAIPADTVIYVLEQFYRFGRVRRPFLGAMILENDQRSPGTEKGALVLEVMKDSAAERAGIREGDMIYQIGETLLTCNPIDFYEEMKQYLPGEEITIVLERGGKKEYLNVVLDSYEMDSVMTKTICITKQMI